MTSNNKVTSDNHVTSDKHHHVEATLKPSGRRFTVQPEQSILESGLGAGIALPFGCANGSCGQCKAVISSGTCKAIKHHDYLLTQVQKLNGFCLMCSYTATSSIEIEVIEATSVSDISLQCLQAKLCRLEKVQQTTIVSFKFVRGHALRFLPGQNATLGLAKGKDVQLPIASCPCNANVVEFHITPDIQALHPDLLDDFQSLKRTKKRLAIEGPSGGFTLSQHLAKPKLFICVGGDFAQLQGMLEQVLSYDDETPCCLIWKESLHIHHYRSNLCRSWHDAFDEFTYIPTAADVNPLDALPGQWQSRLKVAEIYLGVEHEQLIAELVSAGATREAIFHP